MKPTTARFLHSLAALGLLIPLGCGGGGGGGSSGSSGNGITKSLNGLGIDTSESPRRSDDGGSLPDDAHPLGKTRQVDPLMELYVGGVLLHGSSAVATLLEDFSTYPADGAGTITPASLSELSAADAPWWPEDLPAHSFRETKRAVTAADLDGDGIDEIVTVFAEDPHLSLQILRRTETGYATEGQTLLFNRPGIRNVAIAAGDFDGDAKDDLVVGYFADGRVNLLHLVRDEAGNYSIDPGTQRVFEPYLPGASMELILRAGNLDDDDPLELVALVNETAGSSNDPQMTSHFVVLDDAKQDYRELRDGFVEGFEPGVGLRVAAVADVALGNIDGDARDEIVFGGLASLDRNCDGSPYVFVALDDATSSFASLGAKQMNVSLDGCADGPSGYDLRFVQVRTLDLDGDGVDEVLGNQLVFHDWKNAAPWTLAPELSISSREIVDEGGLEWSDRTNVAIAVGDVTGDGRDDILVYRDGRDEVRVFSFEAGETQIRKIGHLSTAHAPGLVNPVLLPVNVDKDTKVIRATGVHRFLYVEPIVIAALAAPPCKFGIGQNVDVCQTTFGNTSSNEGEFERSVSFSVAGIVGGKLDAGPIGDIELEAKVTHSLKLTTGVGYSLEKTVLFTTGPNEDTVVFTTVPIDVYQYQVIQHPNPSLVGAFMDLVLPRAPIFLQVERSFYNAHVPEGSLVVDDSIFSHRIGDPRSYPTRDRKDALLAQYGGLELGPQTVGQGSGETELEMVVGEQWSVGGELETEWELEAKTTVTGVTLGLTLGGAVTNSIQFTSGHSTTYDGVVGSIDAAHYQAEQYAFGLFTYPVFDPNTGRYVEVLNYWVE